MHPLEEPDATDYVGDVTVETEIANLQMEGPHVFLLGAGASKAALPNGDKEGRHVALVLWGLFGDGSHLSQNHREQAVSRWLPGRGTGPVEMLICARDGP